MIALKILTQGIVQGVGFRPYVYRLADELNLKGYVRNLGNVVEIIIEGENTEIFVERLPKELPPIAKINSMEVEAIDKNNYTDFEIIESGDSYSGISVIPPDIAICDKCLEEIRNPNDRRYKYAFNAFGINIAVKVPNELNINPIKALFVTKVFKVSPKFPFGASSFTSTVILSVVIL